MTKRIGILPSTRLWKFCSSTCPPVEALRLDLWVGFDPVEDWSVEMYVPSSIYLQQSEEYTWFRFTLCVTYRLCLFLYFVALYRPVIEVRVGPPRLASTASHDTDYRLYLFVYLTHVHFYTYCLVRSKLDEKAPFFIQRTTKVLFFQIAFLEHLSKFSLK